MNQRKVQNLRLAG